MLKAKARESYFKVLVSSLSRATANVDLAYSKKAMMNKTIPDVTTPGITGGIFPPPETPVSDFNSAPDNPANRCFLTNKFCRQSATRKTSYDSLKEKVLSITHIYCQYN